MLEGFELFSGRAAPVGKAPTVTVQARGLMSINAAAYEALGSPVAVQLGYSAAKRAIAIQPVPKEGLGTYTLRKQGQRGSTWGISGRAFATHYGLNVGASRRYEAEVVKGALVVNLDGPFQPVQGARAKKGDQDTD